MAGRASIGLCLKLASIIFMARGSCDEFLESLRDTGETVCVAKPRNIFGGKPPHPGCVDSMKYILKLFNVESFDLTSLLKIGSEECSSTKIAKGLAASSTNETSDEKSTGWSRSEAPLFDDRNSTGALFLSDLLNPVSVNSTMGDAKGIILNMLKFCITEVPDNLIGLLASKTVGRLLSGLVTRLSISDSLTPPSVVVKMDFLPEDFAGVLCGAADFSLDGDDFDPTWTVCGLSNALAAFVSCSSTEIDPTIDPFTDEDLAPKCDLNPTVHTWPTQSIDLHLQSESDVFGEDGSINSNALDQEGHVYFYDFRSTAFLAESCKESLYQIPPTMKQFIPGWDRVAEIFIEEEGSMTLENGSVDHIGFSTISRRNIRDSSSGTPLDKPACEWHIVTRGTGTDYEWVVNFRAELTPPFIKAPAGSLWHRGYADILTSMMPLIMDYFDTYIGPGKECAYQDSSIHLTGHSLGGGFTSLLAACLASTFGQHQVRLELVNFAPSRGLNEVLANYTRQYVNTRSIVNQLDPIPNLPCANKNGLPRCDSRTYFTFGGVGWDLPYSPHVNTVPITVSDLQALNSTKFANFQLSLTATISGTSLETQVSLPSQLDIVSQHELAYSCWSTHNWCTQDPQILDGGCA